MIFRGTGRNLSQLQVQVAGQINFNLIRRAEPRLPRATATGTVTDLRVCDLRINRVMSGGSRLGNLNPRAAMTICYIACQNC